MVKSRETERGDIVWIDFDPTKGHEQAGLRPAIVISPSKYNSMTGLALVCPITRKQKGYFFEVAIDGPESESYALVDQIRSIDIKERIIKKSGKITNIEMDEILSRVAFLFQ